MPTPWKSAYARARTQARNAYRHEHNRTDPVIKAWKRTARADRTRLPFISLKCFERKLRRQGYRCALTGRPLTPENCSMDHKRPLSRRGTNSIRNLQLVVTEANRAKGALSVIEFKNLCVDVAKKIGGVA